MTEESQAPLIDAQTVQAVFLSCLYKPEEVPDGVPPADAIIIEGITTTFGLHPERLQSHKETVRGWLNALPAEFHRFGGGGWTFLDMCNDKNGRPWTGLHLTMQELLVLGMGLKMASYCLPRDGWKAFPGRVPYVAIDTTGPAAEPPVVPTVS